jgi:hypothetical protein
MIIPKPLYCFKIIISTLLLSTISVEKISAQSELWYKGKMVKSKGSCTWLIRITETNDSAFADKLIYPASKLPDNYLKRGTKIWFEMHPLRQPIPDGCIANVVATVVNPQKL